MFLKGQHILIQNELNIMKVLKTMILSPDENTLAVVLNNMAVGAFSGVKKYDI